jgi:hypothetical protein
MIESLGPYVICGPTSRLDLGQFDVFSRNHDARLASVYLRVRAFL